MEENIFVVSTYRDYDKSRLFVRTDDDLRDVNLTTSLRMSDTFQSANDARLFIQRVIYGEYKPGASRYSVSDWVKNTIRKYPLTVFKLILEPVDEN